MAVVTFVYCETAVLLNSIPVVLTLCLQSNCIALGPPSPVIWRYRKNYSHWGKEWRIAGYILTAFWVKVFKHLSLFQLFISISLWYYKHMCCDVFMCVISGYLCSSFSRPNKSIMFWCVLCLMSLYAWTVFCFNCDLSSKTFLFPVSEMREDHPICDARAQNQSLFDS